MKTVGSYEAKTHLPRLLEQVSKGAEITITRHGKAIARLVPVAPARASAGIAEVIASLKAYSRRAKRKLDLRTQMQLKTQGRR
jgi:prevent-host-death family protein